AAGSLGAANLTGYFAGIGVAALLARRMGPGQMVRLAMLVVSLSFFACGWRGGGLAWFLAWRAAAGACGAILMVQAPVLILPATAPAAADRPAAAGLYPERHRLPAAHPVLGRFSSQRTAPPAGPGRVFLGLFRRRRRLRSVSDRGGGRPRRSRSHPAGGIYFKG